MIEFECSKCGARLRASGTKVGHKVRCPKCNTSLVVPPPTSLVKATVGTDASGGMDLQKALSALGLPPTASPRQARAAFRRLAKRYHPDTGTDRSAERFISLVAAYDFLKKRFQTAGIVAPLPAERGRVGVARVERAVWQVSYGDFVDQLEAATEQAIKTFHQEKDPFAERLRQLIADQIASYSSASEFRDRAKSDLDAIIQRELWAIVERIGRRSVLVESQFREWVLAIRTSAYEVNVPQSLLQYLARPAGLLLSSVIFLGVGSSAYLAMYLSPLPFFTKGPVPILAGVLTAVLSGMIGLWGGKWIYTRSAREQERHTRAILMARTGMDSFRVGAVPISEALSSQERAAIGAGAAAFTTLWFGVEPLTGAIAIALAGLFGWLTGKSFKKTQREAVERVLAALEPRLHDFYEGFVDSILQFNDAHLQRMRAIYLRALGPDARPMVQRQRLFDPEKRELLLKASLSDRPAHAPTGQTDSRGSALSPGEPVLEDAVVNCIRRVMTGHPMSNGYLVPHIPDDKLANAVVSYARDAKAIRVIFLYDLTVWGSAKEGICLTEETLYWKSGEEPPGQVRLRDIKSIRAVAAVGFLGTAGVVIDGKRIEGLDGDSANALTLVIQAARDACTKANGP